ncbi:MAG: hypothetical protein R3F11_06230 [Verrucomicrobiales bacterium]
MAAVGRLERQRQRGERAGEGFERFGDLARLAGAEFLAAEEGEVLASKRWKPLSAPCGSSAIGSTMA